MELKDTLELMTSNDYKDRFRAEYWQTKIRYNKLFEIVTDYDIKKTSFNEPANIKLFRKQAKAMLNYLDALLTIAEIEKIKL